jgi:hypothetical protein
MRIRERWWLVLLLPFAVVVGLLGRQRRSRSGPGRGGGWSPPDAGVREPRRPKPSPSSAAMAIEENGEPVQV